MKLKELLYSTHHNYPPEHDFAIGLKFAGTREVNSAKQKGWGSTLFAMVIRILATRVYPVLCVCENLHNCIL